MKIFDLHRLIDAIQILRGREKRRRGGGEGEEERKAELQGRRVKREERREEGTIICACCCIPPSFLTTSFHVPCSDLSCLSVLVLSCSSSRALSAWQETPAAVRAQGHPRRRRTSHGREEGTDEGSAWPP